MSALNKPGSKTHRYLIEHNAPSVAQLMTEMNNDELSDVLDADHLYVSAWCHRSLPPAEEFERRAQKFIEARLTLAGRYPLAIKLFESKGFVHLAKLTHACRNLSEFIQYGGWKYQTAKNWFTGEDPNPSPVQDERAAYGLVRWYEAHYGEAKPQ